MTPDPSAVPVNVFVAGFSAEVGDELKLLLFVVGMGLFVVALLLGAVVVTTGLRR